MIREYGYLFASSPVFIVTIHEYGYICLHLFVPDVHFVIASQDVHLEFDVI